MTLKFDALNVLSYLLKAKKSVHYDLGGKAGKGHHGHWHDHSHGKGHHDHGKGHGHGHHHDKDKDDDHCDVPCFAAGTIISTIGGDCPVELIQPGDRVITRDNGVQRVAWTGQVTLSNYQLSLLPELRPVLIRSGALNGIAPVRDTVVSPNHRVLIFSAAAQMLFGESEVLVAAQHLVGTPGFESVETGSVTYVHLMFEQHEVILGDGCWSESFQPGDYMLGSMDTGQREEILTLFPDLGAQISADVFRPARRPLRRHEADLLSRIGT